MILSTEQVNEYASYLCREEKSAATQEKYLRDVRAFRGYLGGAEITKEMVIEWKQHLIDERYAVRSINSMLASVNSLLDYLGLPACKVKNIRTQRQTYSTEDKELTKGEYLRLLEASKKNEQLNLVLQTICGTGIRVSELRYFTVEAIRYGEVIVDCKNKVRTILVPGKLKNVLLNYAKRHGITEGVIPHNVTYVLWGCARSPMQLKKYYQYEFEYSNYTPSLHLGNHWRGGFIVHI